jgi:hypothetical protein
MLFQSAGKGRHQQAIRKSSKSLTFQGLRVGNKVSILLAAGESRPEPPQLSQPGGSGADIPEMSPVTYHLLSPGQ